VKEYTSNALRNLALVGNGGAGKTSFAEAALFSAKEISRMGGIADGSTVSDYHPDEILRHISINLSPLHCEWGGIKFNLLDAPGFPDFTGEVNCALRAGDTAVIFADCVAGPSTGADIAWNGAEHEKIAAAFVVTKPDAPAGNYDRAVAQLQDMYGHGVTVVQFPANTGESFNGIVDVLRMKLLTFSTDKSGAFTEEDIPAALKEKADALHQTLVENIAESDEEMMNVFFEKGSLTEEELAIGLRREIAARALFPLMCAAPVLNIGVTSFLTFAERYFPSPLDRPVPAAKNPNTGVDVTIPQNPNGEQALCIFKTVSESHLGELTFFRVFNGAVTPGADLVNFSNGKTERINQIYVLNGKTRKETSKLILGDIGAVVKLKDTHTNNTLAAKTFPVTIVPIPFPIPVADAAIISKSKGDEEKIATGLHALHEEDPTFHMHVDSEAHQTIISGQGEQHLDVIVKRLKEKYGVEVEMKPPRIPYREAIRGRAKNSYRHKKQSGGAGQFAEVHFYVEPYKPNTAPPAEYHVRTEELIDLPWTGTLHFINSIVGGAIDAKFIPAVKKGILESMGRGVIAGYPVSDVRVILFDGMMHPVDSNENAFRTAGRMCFRNAVLEAKPLLMEPIYEIEVTVPEENMGDVMGDLSGKRGKISGMNANGHFQVINAHVPLAELYQYSARLRSQTQGRGAFSRSFYRYEEMPKEIETKVLELSKMTHVEEVE